MMRRSPLVRLRKLLLAAFLRVGSLCHATASVRNERRQNFSHKTVMAWAVGQSWQATVDQLQNKSWDGLIDGVQAFCGVEFDPDSGGISVNQTEWQWCRKIQHVVREKNMEFHVVVNGAVPGAAIQNPQPTIDAIVQLAHELRWDGVSLDDESECAPRSTWMEFQGWMNFVNQLATSLHQHDLPLSAAVQALFGIQNVPYNPKCANDPSAANCSQACDRHPREYPLDKRVLNLLDTSHMDRWLVMDTYYFSTGRFLDALDWHTQYMNTSHLGMSMMNRDDLTDDGLVARFHALHKAQLDWINLFVMPLEDVWQPYLRRWKTNCQGCGVQTVLGCYDRELACDMEGHDQQEKMLALNYLGTSIRRGFQLIFN